MVTQAVIDGCKAEQPHHQRELVVRFAPLLMAVARRYMGDNEKAKDVLQDAFVKIFLNIKSYQPTGSFEAWVRKIVVNTALQALDKNWIKKVQLVEAFENPPAVSPVVLDQLNEAHLLQLIDALPDGHKQVFNLFAIEQYTHKEISALLAISESTSRSQLYRARMLLQQMILQIEPTRT